MSKFDTFKKLMKEDPRRIVKPIANMGFFGFLPDKPYLKLLYYFEMGKKLDLKNPKSFNEKIQWLKLYDRKPHYHDIVDKYAVREYIKEKIGEEYLIPLIAVYEDPDDIDFDKLPRRFVLKCTHGSGCNIICTDKSKLDYEWARNQLRIFMRKNYYKFGREWPYKGIKPRIICEEFISDNENGTPRDYKFLCCRGRAEYVEIMKDRYSGISLAFYDRAFNKTDIEQVYPPATDEVMQMPAKYAEMLEIADKLSEGFTHIRVDLYLVGDKIYFGELTFYDGGGFNHFCKDEYDHILGSFIKLHSEE